MKVTIQFSDFAYFSEFSICLNLNPNLSSIPCSTFEPQRASSTSISNVLCDLP